MIAGLLPLATLQGGTQPVQTPAQWEADLNFLVAHLRGTHPNLHYRVSVASFDSAVGAVRERIPQLSIVERNGRRETVLLTPAGPYRLFAPDTDLSWLPREGWVDLRDRAPATPLWLRAVSNLYWLEYLPAQRTLYAQFNRVGNKAEGEETVAQFAARMYREAETRGAEKLVIDLRLNRGGNGEFNRPIVVGALKALAIDRPGKLFVITGRATWSAAQFLTDDFAEWTNATFVGEPTGSRGNAFGDSRRAGMPNSGITIRSSTLYWQKWDPRDTRRWAEPQIPARLSSTDYAQGIDPALAAILARPVVR